MRGDRELKVGTGLKGTLSAGQTSLRRWINVSVCLLVLFTDNVCLQPSTDHAARFIYDTAASQQKPKRKKRDNRTSYLCHIRMRWRPAKLSSCLGGSGRLIHHVQTALAILSHSSSGYANRPGDSGRQAVDVWGSAIPIRVTGVPYSSAEMAVHFPVPFCPALSRILGSRWVPSASLYLKMLAVISMRKESSSVLFQSSKACVGERRVVTQA